MLYTAIRRTAILLLSLLLICSCAFAAVPEDYSVDKPEILETGHLYGKSCILIDASTGEVLFEKDADTRRYPASTTKIMTLLVALEQGPVNTIVTIPQGISIPSDSSKLGIYAGEQMTFTDLLYGMMMSSGNDAAVAIAMLTSGSELEFVNQMNDKAIELGMTGTHYVNSHGYHLVNHYTTARDLAVLTREAMKNDTFRQIVSTVKYTIPPTNISPERELTTKYELLDSSQPLYYQPCIGVKTGFTNSAGRCFVGAAEQNGIRLISVSLLTDHKSEPRMYAYTFTDTIRMMKYGFLQYQPLTFQEMYSQCEDKKLYANVVKASKSDIDSGVMRMSATGIPSDYSEWYYKKDLQNPTSLTEIIDNFASRLHVDESTLKMTAPLAMGDVMGSITFSARNGVTYTGTLVASRDVEMEPPTVDEVVDEWIDNNAPFLASLMPRRNPPVRILYWILLIGAIALIVWRVKVVRRRNRIRREMLERKRREYIRRQRQRQAYLKAHPEAARQQTVRKPTNNRR